MFRVMSLLREKVTLARLLTLHLEADVALFPFIRGKSVKIAGPGLAMLRAEDAHWRLVDLWGVATVPM
jgi:hypothetical protein